MKNLVLGLAFVLFLVGAVRAEIIEIVPGLRVNLELGSSEWSASPTPPAFLVDEMTEHLAHEVPVGQSVDAERLRDMVIKRLAANELFIFNPASGAHLEVDVSPLREDEREPSKGAVADSARFAGQSLVEEEGVGNVEWKTRKVSIPGAKASYRLDASYTFHGGPRRFVGIVGFSAPYWFYLYFTDPLKTPADAAVVDTLIERLAIDRTKE